MIYNKVIKPLTFHNQ